MKLTISQVWFEQEQKVFPLQEFAVKVGKKEKRSSGFYNPSGPHFLGLEARISNLYIQ